jgi:hypothetical protein
VLTSLLYRVLELEMRIQEEQEKEKELQRLRAGQQQDLKEEELWEDIPPTRPHLDSGLSGQEDEHQDMFDYTTNSEEQNMVPMAQDRLPSQLFASNINTAPQLVAQPVALRTAMK